MQTRIHTRIHLLRGALLKTIAHAIYLIDNPYFAHEITWQNGHYLVNDSAGGIGVVTFRTKGVMGAFYVQESERRPDLLPRYNHRVYLRRMPERLRDVLVDDTLQFMMDDFRGRTAPLITAAFWSEPDGTLTSSESWELCAEHGAYMVEIELMEYEHALDILKEKYRLTSRKMGLLKSLYEQRINPSNRSIRLRADERDILFTDGAEGIMEAAGLLKSIGIVMH